jgi:hypothetical protein
MQAPDRVSGSNMCPKGCGTVLPATLLQLPLFRSKFDYACNTQDSERGRGSINMTPFCIYHRAFMRQDGTLDQRWSIRDGRVESQLTGHI